jgi:hypothetical protein
MAKQAVAPIDEWKTVIDAQMHFNEMLLRTYATTRTSSVPFSLASFRWAYRKRLARACSPAAGMTQVFMAAILFCSI